MVTVAAQAAPRLEADDAEGVEGVEDAEDAEAAEASTKADYEDDAYLAAADDWEDEDGAYDGTIVREELAGLDGALDAAGGSELDLEAYDEADEYVYDDYVDDEEEGEEEYLTAEEEVATVSYTHLTLPTICSV